jgi:hypothetical protein
MTFTTIVSGIFALFKAVPVIEEWFQRFAVQYFNLKIDGMKNENREAIAKAFKDFDQREIEKLLGSKAGERSSVPGAEIRKEIKGVPRA